MINVAMDQQKQNTFTSCSSLNGTSSSTPAVLSPATNHGDSLTHHTHAFATVIPNRIFVGGIDSKVNESELRHVFSQHGAVKEVKIVIDRSGMSKGYGFVTFETKEDALKILNNADGISFKDKKLSIGQAIRKYLPSGQTENDSMACPEPVMPHQMSYGTLHMTTSTGYPYTYHNGVAYFHSPKMNPPAQHWPPAPQMMLSQSHQPVYQQPAYHHYQYAPNQYQWNAVQMAMPSCTVMLSQQSEYLYQPSDGGSIQPPVPVMEDATSKNLMFPPSQVHLKPKHRRLIHHRDYHYMLESTETPETSRFHASQPLI